MKYKGTYRQSKQSHICTLQTNINDEPPTFSKLRIKRSYCATNQYFFLAKTTPMHATNSYSLEQSINNYNTYNETAHTHG